MKKFFSLLLILLAATFSLSAQTITVQLSGTVVRDSTNLPVANHEVIIQADSNAYGFTFYATRLTNQNGFYDCTIHNVPSTGAAVAFMVETKNCDSTWLMKDFTGTNTPDTVNFIICNGNEAGCHALYNYYADSVNVLMLHFWDVSTPLNMITSRLWNFGDPASGINNTATTVDPWHTYSQAGVYVVCLTIHTSTGCTSTKCDSITVGPNPTNCENWITFTSSGLTFNFEGHTHSIYPTTYSWNFGDPQSGNNNVSTLKNPVHVFTTAGTYVIALHTIDSTGCEWNRSQTIYVNTTCDLNGTVYLSNDLTVDHGLAELLRVDSGMVNTVASQEFGDSLGMYWFGGVLPGHYYIRATLLPTSAYYGQYVPTYYIDAANWDYAHLIELGQPTNPYNIHMHHVNSYSPGSGNINGTINQNAKYNGNGTPAANVEVLLLDVSGQILAFTMTNTSGEFSFTEMAMGTYKVYPEMIEKVTTPTTVTLDATHPGANVVFTIQGGNISGIHDETAQSDFVISNIYPNPVSDFANLTISTLHSTRVSVSLYSITGEFVTDIPVILHQGANKIAIPVSDLRKGLYYIKVERPEGGIIVKKFILGR